MIFFPCGKSEVSGAVVISDSEVSGVADISEVSGAAENNDNVQTISYLAFICTCFFLTESAELAEVGKC